MFNVDEQMFEGNFIRVRNILEKEKQTSKPVGVVWCADIKHKKFYFYTGVGNQVSFIVPRKQKQMLVKGLKSLVRMAEAIIR